MQLEVFKQYVSTLVSQHGVAKSAACKSVDWWLTDYQNSLYICSLSQLLSLNLNFKTKNKKQLIQQ